MRRPPRRAKSGPDRPPHANTETQTRTKDTTARRHRGPFPCRSFRQLQVDGLLQTYVEIGRGQA